MNSPAVPATPPNAIGKKLASDSLGVFNALWRHACKSVGGGLVVIRKNPAKVRRYPKAGPKRKSATPMMRAGP